MDELRPTYQLKDDEMRLLQWIINGVYPRDYPTDDIPFRRRIYIISKWTRKGWYDYGVSEDLGWLTEKGLEEAHRRGIWPQYVIMKEPHPAVFTINRTQ